MQVYRREFKLLRKVQDLTDRAFSNLGVNKKQDLTRLFYEISKKEQISPFTLLKDIDRKNFHSIKQDLLKRRYPLSFINNELSKVHLPKIRLDPSLCQDLKKAPFYPKKIFIEKSAGHSTIANRFKKSFPKAAFKEIESLKLYLRQRPFNIQDYNNRRSTVFITYENYDFFKKCPCTQKALKCGYNIFNLSFGCLFDCTYCYLQEYVNTPGLIFPANLDRFFNTFTSYKKVGMRMGTGEFSDSLMLDHMTEYCLSVVDFFKKHPDVTFEFKTKSTNIDNLLKINPSQNIVIAWSLNPQRIIDENEFFTPNLHERIEASLRCAKAGYKLAFHFDPVIYFKDWEIEYRKVVELLFSAIKPDYISWISIGTLRFNPKVKEAIEVRFPGNKILDEELVLGFDNKLRYPYHLRYKIYQSMLKMLLLHSKKLPIYLCMEDRSMWRNFKKDLTLF
ncbi:radical SAM protein [Candidatus Omnitrophota bacterium]